MKRLLIYLGIIVLAIVGFLGALVYITPTGFRVERDIVINKPKAEVFDYVVKLKNQEKWGPWAKKDPKVKLIYTGEDGTEGFISRWESDHEELGTGEQEIKKIDQGNRIDLELRFEEPWESKTEGYLVTSEEGADKTRVRWGFAGKMPRPFNLMLIFTDFEAQVAKDFDQGLADLKIEVEKLPSKPKPEVSDDKTADKEDDGEAEQSETKEDPKKED